jgi:DnaJ family protein B protein 4
VIWKGYSKTVRLTNKHEGNESPNFDASDLIFEIVEEEDDMFIRDGDDLVYTHALTLLEALEANAITIMAPDGRVLTLSLDMVVNPKSEYVIENEGMPKLAMSGSDDVLEYGRSKRASAHGNLIVRFNILFPRYLPDDKKIALRNCFE